MAKRIQDDVPERRETSILRMVDAVDRPRRVRGHRVPYLLPRRRVLLWSIGATTVVTGVATTIGVFATESSRDHHADGPRPVHDGPPTVAEAGKLGGPARAPRWSATTGDDVQWLAAAGDRVLACGDALTAYDGASGRILWTSTDAAMPYLYNTPPFVVGDTVYGVDDSGRIVAVDAADGSVAWRVDQPADDWYAWGIAAVAGRFLVATGIVDARSAAPVGAATAADNNATSSAAGGTGGTSSGSTSAPPAKDAPLSIPILWIVDIEARRTLWAAPVGGANDPAIAFNEKAGIIGLYDERSGVLTAYDVRQGGVRWRLTDPSWTSDDTPYACSMAAHEDTLYLAATDLLAVDAATGTVQWKAEAPNAPYGLYHAVAVVSAAPTPATSAAPGTTAAAGTTDLVIAAATGSLDPGELRAWHAATGDQVWAEAGDDDFGLGRFLTVDDGNLFYPVRYNGSLYAVDAATGQTRWTYHDGSATTDMQFTAAAANGRTYLHYGTKLHAFDGGAGPGTSATRSSSNPT